MLRIYDVVIEVVRGLRPVVAEIEKKDPDLGRQMRRAMCSVPLNLSEGMYSKGRSQGLRYHTAMGSMRETLACVEVGVALGYVGGVDEALLDRIDRVVATLYKLSK